ncbi:hypothetical protein A0J48_025740 [Sphaerospermopsis aphanizomenoides BCCUSP55]|uniref:hypothetical protein n=1 Tax=Sphaerospermopsis aphanizomenoides TaxID=459663 RepID=UPI001903C383|nr:hypothetical protein [Sphaerospermopsis aphanizomenoides]MBK1990869.1 hypothetical protein [Sphaerospermopsis aphanizomenoides BCCUSP55]
MTNQKPKGTYECNLELKNKTVVLTFKSSSVELAIKLFIVLTKIVDQLQLGNLNNLITNPCKKMTNVSVTTVKQNSR